MQSEFGSRAATAPANIVPCVNAGRILDPFPADAPEVNLQPTLTPAESQRVPLVRGLER
jgi:hypothetical protein